jgi:uncharacterized RDD family membrane protein YckC
MARAFLHKSMTVNAPIWKRFIAFILDLLILNIIVVYPFQSLVASVIPSKDFMTTYSYLSAHTPPRSLYAIIIAVAILSVLYFAMLERRTGTTIGKMVLSLSVVPTGGDNHAWRYYARSLFLIPVLPFILLGVVDPVYMLFNEDHQRFTEYLSRTKVVEKLSW